jgi:hypothetical protein
LFSVTTGKNRLTRFFSKESGCTATLILMRVFKPFTSNSLKRFPGVKGYLLSCSSDLSLDPSLSVNIFIFYLTFYLTRQVSLIKNKFLFTKTGLGTVG